MPYKKPYFQQPKTGPVEIDKEELKKLIWGADRDGDIPQDEFDPVEHPYHYAKGSLECIDWIRYELSPEEFRGFLKGNVMKYLWRYEDKGKPVEDLKKAIWYLGKLRDQVDYERENPDISGE